MIVKVVEKRGPFLASSDGPTVSLGDQTTWIDGVLRAQIVEEVEKAPDEVAAASFFAHTHFFGTVASRDDYEAEVLRARQQGEPLPLPNTRWQIVWLYRDGGNSEIVDQLVMGDLVQAWLMSDEGKTIDRLR